MKISKELIEKYHHGNCTPEEKAAVEEWLLNDEFDELSLPETINKYADKRDMWENISSFIDEDAKNGHPHKNNQTISLIGKIAASLFFILAVAGVLYYSLFNKKESQQIFSFDNSIGDEVKHVDYCHYTISIAPKSNGKIDLNSGLMDFCGSILLSPKKDMELTVEGHANKVKLKTGQTYIVFSNSCPAIQTIIINEKDIFYLPPVIQKQLIVQFNI